MPILKPLKMELIVDAWASWARQAVDGVLPSRCYLYVHSPYCRQKCTYCQYDSVILPEPGRLEGALQNLQAEVDAVSPVFRDIRLMGAVLGGGTPSLYSDTQFESMLEKLFSSFKFVDAPFNSCEMHPASATEEKIRIAAGYGVNRISLGVQSFTPEVLRAVNRIEVSPDHLKKLIRTARDEGVAEVNVDLIVPLPKETPESFMRSLDQVADCEPDSIVLYRYSTSNNYNLPEIEHSDFSRNLASWPTARNLFLEWMDSHGYVTSEKAASLLSSIVCYRPPQAFPPQNRYELFSHEPQSVLGLGAMAKSNIFAHMYYQNRGTPSAVFPEKSRYEGFDKSLYFEAVMILCYRIRNKIPLSRREFAKLIGFDPVTFFNHEIKLLHKKRLVDIDDHELRWKMHFNSEDQFKDFQNMLFGLEV